jgi:hypothetical protein
VPNSFCPSLYVHAYVPTASAGCRSRHSLVLQLLPPWLKKDKRRKLFRALRSCTLPSKYRIHRRHRSAVQERKRQTKSTHRPCPLFPYPAKRKTSESTRLSSHISLILPDDPPVPTRGPGFFVVYPFSHARQLKEMKETLLPSWASE